MTILHNPVMPALVLSFLGGFQVLLDQQPITRFRSANNQGLLVYLACESDKPISRETLTALFWPEAPEKEARHNLRQALYRLRRLLPGGESDYLLVTRQTVQFNRAANYVLDVEQFRAAIEAYTLNQAVDLYAGDLLPGFPGSSQPFEVWLRQRRELLHQLALEAMLQVAEDSLGAGEYGTAVALAQRQLLLEPWREPAFRQLMRAHALMGNRGQALAQFERCREQLWTELAVEPAPETVQLVDDIRAGRLGATAADSPLAPPAKVRHNLPADTTPFIGRKRESAEISAQFTEAERRLVTIVAPGGMGKTRLAIEVGRRLLPTFPDGVTFVDLAAITDPDEIATEIAAALNYQAPEKTQALLPQLLRALAQRRLLLILDNFEQLLDGAAHVDHLLRACPQLSILVTSRQPLNLVSESRYRLLGLDFPDLLTVDDALAWSAVQLFVDSGARARPGYALVHDDIVYVLHICRLVQGMPLALILAAAWLELLTLAEIAVEIERRLDFLSADLADLPQRQRSMRAVFARSWQRLRPDEQVALARLSVFRGGFSRAAAEQVAGANLRILLSLMNKSFLERQADSSRYTIHELLRQYAAERLDEMASQAEAHHAHCRYFAQIVSRERRRVLYFLPLLLPRDYAADRENFQHAWEYALSQPLPGEMADLSTGMITFDDAQGIQPTARIDEAVLSASALDASGADPALLRLRAAQLFARQMVHATTEVNEQFISLINELERHAQHELRYWLCVRLAMQWRDAGDPSLIDWLDEAQAIAEVLHNEPLIEMASAMRLWGFLLSDQPVANAQATLQHLLTYFDSTFPHSFIRYGILRSLSLACGNDGQFEAAIRYGKNALNIVLGWGELFGIRATYEFLAREYERNRQFEQAMAQHLQSLEWHVARGSGWQVLTFIASVVVYSPHLIDDDESKIKYLSMIDHHPESRAYIHHLIKASVSALKKNCGENAFAAAWKAGKGLKINDVVQQLRERWAQVSGLSATPLPRPR